MVKKTIKYSDYNGNEREEDFYFNLSKVELLEMEMSAEGGLENKIKKIVESDDKVEIIKYFKDIIKQSYGKKSEDGKRFIKDPKDFEEFAQTEAYVNLFMELSTISDAAANFVYVIFLQGLKYYWFYKWWK